ncbi:MAG: hypothetical protein Q8K91_11610 [Hylemonella sp.]|nr:hypothetical protein [Hylemonella sp.]MDP1937843.1 hypothetical protein [Hylemonella sp.]
MKNKEREIVIRLSGLANKGGRIDQALKNFCDLPFLVDGNDLVVWNDDFCLNVEPRLFVTRSAAEPLKIAEAVKRLAIAFETAPERPGENTPPKDIPLLQGMGFLSELRKASLEFFFTPRKQLLSCLEQSVIPMMTSKKFGGEYGIALQMDVRSFYTRVSAPKFLYLLRKHDSNFEQVGALALNQGVYRSLLPTPIEPLDMVESFLLFPPYIAGYSLTRATSCLVVTGSKIVSLHPQAFGGLASTLKVDSAPLTSGGSSAQLSRQRYDGEALDFLDVAIAASNGYWNYLTLPTNWVGDLRQWDVLRQMKALAVGRLMVADMAAIAITLSNHARNRIAFDFFDKLANLCIATLPKAALKDRVQVLEARCANLFLTQRGVELAINVLNAHRRSGGKKIAVVIKAYAKNILRNLNSDFNDMHAQMQQKATEKSILQGV